MTENACSTISFPYELLTVGLSSEPGISDFVMFPNPANDRIILAFISGKENMLQISIESLVGQTIYSESIMNFSGRYHNNIRLNDFVPGTYFVRIMSENYSINRKLMIE